MGREIRRVPPDWEHPRDAEGEYIPLLDEDYDAAAAAWIAAVIAWEEGRDADRRRWEAEAGGRRYYWEWAHDPPSRDAYRTRVWTEAEATAVQLYETVTEGTPVSPVLPDLDALAAWLGDDADLIPGWLTDEAWRREYRRRVQEARRTGAPLVPPTFEEVR